MVMSNSDANTAPQESRIELQPWHIIVFVALAACAYEPKLLWVVGSMGVAGYIVWNVTEKQRIARERAARLSALVNLCAPVVVGSLWVTEDVNSVMDRVEQIKQDLVDSGNPYATKIPVVSYPYSPMLFEVGQLTMSWGIYQRLVGERQHLENMKWYEGDCPANLKALFASQVMPAPKQNIEWSN